MFTYKEKRKLSPWPHNYDARGLVLSMTDPLGSITTMAYDAAGNRTAITDPLNHTTTFQYDALNRVTAQTNPLGQTVTATFDAAGNVSSMTDPLSHVTSYAYDAANRRTTTTEAVGTALQRTGTVGYDAVGNVLTQTDPLNHTTTFSYDALSRRTVVQAPLSRTTTVGYDAVGNVVSVTDPLGKVTSAAYDDRNRMTTLTDPLSQMSHSMPNALGQAAGSVDALGNAARTAYDALGRPVAQLDARAGLIVYRYDARGNLLSLVDPVGNPTDWTYDGANREIRRIDPLGKVTTTAYDAAGRVTSVTDRLSRQQLYTYDAANRVTGGTWKTSGGTTVNTQTFTYDALGQALTASDNSGTITSTYDALNRLATQTNPFGITLTFTYDAADRRTRVDDSLGGVVTSTYDAANRLTSRGLSGTGVTVARIDLSYTGRDEQSTLSRYSNLAGTTLLGTSALAYDDKGRMTSVVHKNAASTPLSTYSYQYDNADRLTQESGTGGTRTYTYDATNQLTNDGTTTYTYDLNGNRTMSGYTTGTGNRLSSDGTWTYSYDDEGNLTQKTKGSGLETWYYTWDNGNRLTNVRKTSNGSSDQLRVTYMYDVSGNRIQEDRWQTGGSTSTTRFAYDGWDVWADLDGSNGVKARYLRGDVVDQIFARSIPTGQTNAGVAWYLTDRLGSVRDLMDGNQVVQDRLDYDGFGQVTETNTAFGDRYKWTGREFDVGTGLQHNRARSYAPGMGRWVSEDPIGFSAGDRNLFRYIANSTQSAIDPQGTQPFRKEYTKDLLSRDHFGKIQALNELLDYLKNNDNKFNPPLSATENYVLIMLLTWGEQTGFSIFFNTGVYEALRYQLIKYVQQRAMTMAGYYALSTTGIGIQEYLVFLIQQTMSEEFRERERASAQLTAMGDLGVGAYIYYLEFYNGNLCPEGKARMKTTHNAYLESQSAYWGGQALLELMEFGDRKTVKETLERIMRTEVLKNQHQNYMAEWAKAGLEGLKK